MWIFALLDSLDYPTRFFEASVAFPIDASLKDRRFAFHVIGSRVEFKGFIADSNTVVGALHPETAW